MIMQESVKTACHANNENSVQSHAHCVQLKYQTLNRQPILQAQIKRLEPLLAALAAVPWIDSGAEDGQRVPFIKSTVLDEVEGMGKCSTQQSTLCPFHVLLKNNTVANAHT